MKITLELTEEQQDEIVQKVLFLLPDRGGGKDSKNQMREKAELLRKKKLSFREIGDILGISYQTVSNWLSEDLTNNKDERGVRKAKNG